MKTALYIGLIIVVAGVFYLIGQSTALDVTVDPLEVTPSQESIDFEFAVENLPRGSLNIPAQWLIMDSMVGEEKMMLIFGYADNRGVCEHLKKVAEEESPNRDFSCQNAN